LPTEKQDMVLRVFKISGHQFQEVAGRKGVLLRKLAKYCLSSGDPNAGIDDCFGRKPISVAALDAENIPGQVEVSDLPTTIPEKLERPHGTRLNLVEPIRRLSFSKNLSTSAIPEIVPERTSFSQAERIYCAMHGTSKHTIKVATMSRRDVADYLGLTHETVSRSLSHLRREGILAFPGISQRQIVLHDRSRLVQLAFLSDIGSQLS
jgi:Crp-like helix-turn-helix domain